MVKGTWFDSFHFEGEDPHAVINTADCNGRVYTNDELESIIVELESSKDYCHYDQVTLDFIDEIVFKARAGIETNE